MELKEYVDVNAGPERGDFYVESQCCLSCGVPQAVAPDLVGWTNDNQTQCYWKKQPETLDELQQAFAIFDGQEVGCHRYRGSESTIQARIGRENCDYPLSRKTIWSSQMTAPELKFWTQAGFFERLWARFTKLN